MDVSVLRCMVSDAREWMQENKYPPDIVRLFVRCLKDPSKVEGVSEAYRPEFIVSLLLKSVAFRDLVKFSRLTEPLALFIYRWRLNKGF